MCSGQTDLLQEEQTRDVFLSLLRGHSEHRERLLVIFELVANTDRPTVGRGLDQELYLLMQVMQHLRHIV